MLNIKLELITMVYNKKLAPLLMLKKIIGYKRLCPIYFSHSAGEEFFKILSFMQNLCFIHLRLVIVFILNFTIFLLFVLNPLKGALIQVPFLCLNKVCFIFIST